MRARCCLLYTSLSLCLALAACGAEESPVSDAPAADDGLVDYTVEGVGTFRLPEGFEMETGSTTDPLPTNYVVFEKDGVTISCSRFGKDAYEASGVPLPADVEEYSCLLYTSTGEDRLRRL